jgi:hypothetical protein
MDDRPEDSIAVPSQFVKRNVSPVASEVTVRQGNLALL